MIFFPWYYSIRYVGTRSSFQVWRERKGECKKKKRERAKVSGGKVIFLCIDYYSKLSLIFSRAHIHNLTCKALDIQLIKLAKLPYIYSILKWVLVLHFSQLPHHFWDCARFAGFTQPISCSSTPQACMKDREGRKWLHCTCIRTAERSGVEYAFHCTRCFRYALGWFTSVIAPLDPSWCAKFRKLDTK